jgi:hypothetical protein
MKLKFEKQKFKETQVEEEVEVTTFFISETNLRNCPHVHVQVANESTFATAELGSEISILN